jgi:hypothetical protein
MPIVAIPGKGNVQFPDSMSAAEIQRVIETEILPASTGTPRQRAIAAEREASAAELAKTESRWQGEPNTLERIANVIAAVTPGKTAREQSLEAARAKAAETQDRLAREEAYIRRTGADPERLTMLERIREGAKDIPRSAIEGFGRVASVAGAFGEPGERLARGIEERATGLAESIGLKPDERAEFDPLQRNIQKVTSGLGSTLPFVATEVAGRKLQPFIKGAGAVARGAQVALGSGAGASEQRRSIEEYEAETGEKVGPVVRAFSQAAAGAVGLSEIVPIANMVNRLPPSLRGPAFSGAAALMKRIGAGEVTQSAGMATLREGIEALERRALGRVGLSAVEEGAQEAGAQAAQNVIARLGYDPNQEIGEGVGEAALIGGLVGGAIRGGTEVATGAPTLAAPEAVVAPPSDTEIVVDGQRRPDLEARVARPDEVIEGEVVQPQPIRPSGSETTVTVDGQRRPDIEGALFAEPTVSEDVTAPQVPEVAPEIIAEPVAEPVVAEPEIAAPPVSEPALGPVTIRPTEEGGEAQTWEILTPPDEQGVQEVRLPNGLNARFPESFISARIVAPEPVSAPAEPIDVTDAAPPAEPPAAPPAQPPAPPPAAPAAPTTPATPIKLGKETFADKFVRVTANRMRRLGYVEEQIEQATGSAIPRDQRPSEKAALFEGRATPRIDELQRDNFQPLLDAITQDGLTANEVDLYLLARAAPARNAKIAERNPAMPDGGSGMTNADAQAYLDMFAAEGKTPALERMAERFDALTERTRQTLVDYDLITPDQASALVASEPQYAPFKGQALDGDTTQMEDDNSGAFMSPGFTITPREYKPAKGRSTLPFSPLATAMADAQAAIIRGETNRYRKTFLDMVRSNPSEYWQVFTEENPDVDRVFDSRTGKVSERPVNMRALPDKYLIVKEGGTPQYIKINDPLLMRAMTNASAKEWGAINRALGATIGAATRGLSKLYTTLNPEFTVTNFSRDIQAAVFNVLAEQGRTDGRIVGQNIVSGVAKDMADWKNWRDLFRSTFNHTARTPEQQAMNALFLQAKEDGAFTGWVQRESPELHMKKIQQTIADATAVGAAKTLAGVKKGVKKTIEAIEDVNSVFENSIRLAVYKNALEAGVTRDEAANMARNVTVDFNRKGELGPTFNSLYAFFNAAVQGNTQLLRSLTNVKGGPITLAQKAALGMVAIGFMRSLYNSAMADDDEDGKSFYDKIPDHVKQRNMVFMNPVDNRSYGLIPLPYGYSFFDNIGATVADVMRGQKDATEAGGFLFGGILNNFSPIPVNMQTTENFLTSFVPTVFKPAADLLANRNYFGSEIFNEPFVRGEAYSANPRFSTPQVYKDIAVWMNEATGGQGRVREWGDVPAEALKYAVEQYIGGLGNLIFQSIDVGTKAATGRDVELGQIPFVRRLVGEPSKQADLGDYYDRINAIGPIERQLKDADPKERAALLKDHPVEADPAVMAARKVAMRRAKEINKQKRAILESDMDWIARNKELDRLNELQRQAYRTFNTVYNRVEKERR